MNKQGNKIIHTKNSIKQQKKLNKLQHHLTNIRRDYNHKLTSEIVRTKPSMIVVETLKISNMMKNKHLSRAIQEQCWFGIQRMLKYKSERIGTKFLKTPSSYPSTKRCSKCGSVKQQMSLSERTYSCTNCNTKIDRDYNSALNLEKYGQQEFITTSRV